MSTFGLINLDTRQLVTNLDSEDRFTLDSGIAFTMTALVNESNIDITITQDATVKTYTLDPTGTPSYGIYFKDEDFPTLVEGKLPEFYYNINVITPIVDEGNAKFNANFVNINTEELAFIGTTGISYKAINKSFINTFNAEQELKFLHNYVKILMQNKN